MNKKVKICLLILSLTLLNGCWDLTELDDVGLITGIAIEKGKDKKYKMYVESVNAQELSKQSATGNAPVIVYTLEGESISELSRKMNIGLARKLIYSHTRVLVIDEEIAKAGLFDFLDYLERDGEFRNDFNIIISQGVRASDIIKITFPKEKIPSIKIHQQIQTFADQWGGNPHIRLTDFLTALISKGRQPVAIAVSLKGDPKKGSSVENNKTIDIDSIVEMSGMAVFKYDKLLGFLNENETRNFVWTRDLKMTSITVPCSNDKLFGVRITNSNAKLSTTYKNGAPSVNVRIDGEARIEGITCQEDITTTQAYKELEKKINKFIENEIKSTIVTIQKEYKVDIFGFGEQLEKKNYKKFKKVSGIWDEEFTRATVNVKANMYLRRSGIRNKSHLSELGKVVDEGEN